MIIRKIILKKPHKNSRILTHAQQAFKSRRCVKTFWSIQQRKSQRASSIERSRCGVGSIESCSPFNKRFIELPPHRWIASKKIINKYKLSLAFYLAQHWFSRICFILFIFSSRWREIEKFIPSRKIVKGNSAIVPDLS